MLERLRQQATATPARRRTLKALAVLFGLWVVLSLFAWLAGPKLITDAATGFVQREFGHRLVIRELQVNPLKLALTVRGLSLADPQGRALVSFDAMVVDVDITSLFRAMAILDEFRLDGLTLNVERLDADRFNFSDLADRLAKRFAAQQPAPDANKPAVKEETAPFYFLIRHTEVNNAAFRFADHTRQPLYEAWIRPLNLRMNDLTSRPDREAPYNFNATIGDSGALAWKGDLTLEPLRSTGRVTLGNLGLTAPYDYVKDSFGFALPAGTLDVSVDYTADFATSPGVLRIDDGQVEVKGLSLTDLEGQPLFAFDSTTVSGIRADVMKTRASVERVETKGGRVNLVIDEGGRSNVERALLPRVAPAPVAVAPADPAAKASTAPAAAGGWIVDVKTAAITDYRLDLVDRSTTPDASVQVAHVDFTATGIHLPTLPAIGFTLGGNLGGGDAEAGAFALKGQYTLDGGVVDSDVQLTRLPLAIASPYLGAFAHVSLLSGTADWNGHVHGTRNLAGDVRLTGGGRLAGITVRDDLRKTKLASLDELALDGLDLAQGAAPHLALHRLAIGGLDVDVALDRNGVSNLQQVLVAPASPATGAAAKPAPAAAAQPPAAKAMPVRLDTLVLRDNTFRFRDQSPDLSFSTQVTGFGGHVDGLSSDPAKRATVQLDGKIDRYAPVSVTGEINPLAAVTYTDLHVKLLSLDLSALTPYTVTYIAYPLERGKLGVQLDWKVAERKFDAQNRVRIEGLALGGKRDAPRATKLPVKLGIALLTDRNGDADLSVPAYGDLDDPQFRYGKVIWQALGNLITRAAAAPFAALGNLGGGDKPDVVAFPAGDATLPADAAARLAKLAQAVADKPLLSLSVSGGASTDSDRRALRQALLETRLKRAYLDSPFRRGMTVDQVTLSAAQRADELEALYRHGGASPDDLRDATGKPLDEAAKRAAMEDALLARITVDDGALRELARSRAEHVKDALIAAGIPEARLFLVDAPLLSAGDTVPTTLALDAK